MHPPQPPPPPPAAPAPTVRKHEEQSQPQSEPPAQENSDTPAAGDATFSNGDKAVKEEGSEEKDRHRSNRPHVSTFVCIGKINESVPDEEIEKLVKACGDVKTVRRMHDPLSHKARRFAFCEFHDAEGVLVAMRLLQNLEVHGERLAISINSSTKSFIQYHKANERSEPEGCEADQQADAKARELIDTVLGEYEEEWKEAKQQADEVLAEIEEEGALEAKGGAEENKEQPPEEKDRGDEGKDRAEREYQRREQEWERHEAEVEKKLAEEKRKEEQAWVARKRALEMDLAIDRQCGRTEEERRKRREFRDQERKEDKEAEIRRSGHQGAPTTASEEDRKQAKAGASSASVKIGLSSTKKRKAPKAGLLATEEEEEEERKRKQRAGIATISSSREELENLRDAKPQTDKAEDEEALPEADGGEKQKHEERQEPSTDERSIMAELPSEPVAVYKAEVDWSAFERANGLRRVREWLEGKVAELLGESDQEMITFVAEKVEARNSASEVDDEMRPILEEETEQFVGQLFRVVQTVAKKQLREEDNG